MMKWSGLRYRTLVKSSSRVSLVIERATAFQLATAFQTNRRSRLITATSSSTKALISVSN